MCQADEQGGRQEGQWVRGERGTEQREGGCTYYDENEPAVFQQIAERHDQQQTGDIADLCQGDDQSGRLRRQAERRGDRSGQRLGIIDVGGDQPAGCRQKQGHPCGNCRKRYRCRRIGSFYGGGNRELHKWGIFIP